MGSNKRVLGHTPFDQSRAFPRCTFDRLCSSNRTTRLRHCPFRVLVWRLPMMSSYIIFVSLTLSRLNRLACCTPKTRKKIYIIIMTIIYRYSIMTMNVIIFSKTKVLRIYHFRRIPEFFYTRLTLSSPRELYYITRSEPASSIYYHLAGRL